MTIAEQVYAFYIPTVTFLGFGAHKQLGKQIKALAGVRKPFICTDKGITKAEITQKIVDLIKADTGLDPVVFDETAANPTDNNVHDGLKVYQDYGCDMIISLGGGSSHDCAKGIGILATNGGDIRDYEGTDKSKKNMPPFIAVNTTAGTASEMTRFCIITDTSRKVKMPIIDQRVTPNVAINDPLLMMSMPPSLTAATGMDALTHAIEAYVSTMATPITDSCALKAISLITNSLRAAVANGRDPVARENMAYAEYLAGMAFNSASLGHVHAMAHQLGGFYDLPHGVSNAILLPHVEQYNLMAKMDRFVDIAVAMGEKVAGMSQRTAAERAIEAMKVLASDIGIPGRLRDLGVREKDLPLMAKNAQKDACSFTNPRCPSLEDIVNIYKSAL